MCGRVVSSLPRQFIEDYFRVESSITPEVPPSYNAAPGASLYVVANTRAGRGLGALRWGLVPPWADNPDRGPRPINARAETVFDKPVFADAMAEGRRCLVPAAGFYEFVASPSGKQPFLLTAADDSPLAMAGLWSRWSRPGVESMVTFTIVTTAANDDVAPLHDRMPALLRPEEWDPWLDRGNRDVDELAAMLSPSPSGTLVARPVSPRVNDARNDGPELLSA